MVSIDALPPEPTRFRYRSGSRPGRRGQPAPFASHGVVSVTNSTAGTDGLDLFGTRFSIGATAVSALLFLLGIALGVMGFQQMSIPLAGELSIVTGAVGLLFGLFFGLVALVAAAYMEPGFDDGH